MNELTIIFLLVGYATWFYAGYILGKAKERKEWNKLTENTDEINNL
jgi:hypothetical protein